MSYLDKKMKLFGKMKRNYEDADYPDQVTNLSIEVNGSKSLLASFEPPAKLNTPYIIKYSSKFK